MGRSKMKYIHSEETLTVPEGVKVTIKSRLVTVEGPRGKLTKNLNHLAVNFSHPKKDVINVDKNSETGLYEVEIRNFIGEKIVRRVVMQPGVEVEPSKNQKDELQLFGNSLENVSQSAADIQQICRVRNKDIRKFLDGL